MSACLTKAVSVRLENNVGLVSMKVDVGGLEEIVRDKVRFFPLRSISMPNTNL